MLAQANRLRRNEEVMRVLKGGRFVRGEIVNLKYIRHSETTRSVDEESHNVGDPSRGRRLAQDDNVRAAVVVSKKVFKRAVDRNRAKRLVRESVRLLLKENNPPSQNASEGHGIKAGYDLVFLVQSGIRGKKQQDVQGEIEELLGKAGVLV